MGFGGNLSLLLLPIRTQANNQEVSGVEVAAGISIGEIGPRVFAIEGQEQVMASQMVHVADRFEQIGTQVEQVSEMSIRENTLMQCILGMDRRLDDLERRPPGPQ
ncbi:hypothetical protein Tco_0441790 [Tanacetum coccineum]